MLLAKVLGFTEDDAEATTSTRRVEALETIRAKANSMSSYFGLFKVAMSNEDWPAIFDELQNMCATTSMTAQPLCAAFEKYNKCMQGDGDTKKENAKLEKVMLLALEACVLEGGEAHRGPVTKVIQGQHRLSRIIIK